MDRDRGAKKRGRATTEEGEIKRNKAECDGAVKPEREREREGDQIEVCLGGGESGSSEGRARLEKEGRATILITLT